MDRQQSTTPSSWLNRIERAGNRLPEPVTLFAISAVAVVMLAQVAVVLGWAAEKTVVAAGGLERTQVHAQSLLSSEGIWWIFSHLVKNFIEFPPLGIVLVAMFGIGVAERSGLLGAVMHAGLQRVSANWLTPAVMFMGIQSSLALDAGYIVLPPLVAELYRAAGRPPLAGLAAVFAGIAGGFSANLLVTGLDPLLAGFTQSAAQLVRPGYQIAVTCNWWLMIASTLVLTFTGWWVTARWIEPRLLASSADSASPAVVTPGFVREQRALRVAGVALIVLVGGLATLILWPGAPLAGQGAKFPRWVESTVPILLLVFLVPGLVYGRCAGTIRNDADVARMLGDTAAAMGPYLVMAFAAAQFIGFFNYSKLGEMFALAGGSWLAQARLPHTLLLMAFSVLSMVADLFVGSASAKYAFLAPVFVPLYMQAGIAPELTQAAYRIADSVTNVITPFNPYYTIILAAVRRYDRNAGLGTLVSLMLPYTLMFAVVWFALLAMWIALGWPLGPG